MISRPRIGQPQLKTQVHRKLLKTQFRQLKLPRKTVSVPEVPVPKAPDLEHLPNGIVGTPYSERFELETVIVGEPEIFVRDADGQEPKFKRGIDLPSVGSQPRLDNRYTYG